MEFHQKDPAALWDLARDISTSQDAETFFTRLMRETENLADPAARSLLNTGIQSLMERSRADAGVGAQIINTYILPLCLEQNTLLSQTLLDPRGARDVLANWLALYPDESRAPLRKV